MNEHTVDISRCHASGCPCLGTMSTDTSGENKKWYCSVHFRQDGDAQQRITNELMRMSWLVGVIEAIRNSYINDGWDSDATNYHFQMNNRNDLKYGKDVNDNLAGSYLRRLESELRKSCLSNNATAQPSPQNV